MATPRWKLALDKALAASPKATVFQLASIDVNTPVPHVRSLIFRSFVSPTHDETHPLLLATTDIRTPKTAQLIANPHVQVAWWIEGAQEQYRFTGTARVIPAPSQALHKHFMHSLVELRSESSAKSFDWEAKRLSVFRSMSPYMKASWCRPVPGSRLEDAGGEEGARRWPVEIEEPAEGDEEGQRLWEISLANFALVVIEPSEVDHVELTPVPNLRTRYWRTKDGVWKDEGLVP